MIEIKEALPNEYNIIQHIAYKTWPVTYAGILSQPQLDYMLNLFYALPALNKNTEDGHHFLIARDGGEPVGFAAIEHNYWGRNATRIHKIYVLPESQGKGVGKELIQTISLLAIKQNATALSLNVNRSNNAREFYTALGFTIVGSEDVPLEHGYLMEDFIMEKPL